MGIVIEYASRSGKPQWGQPQQLIWDYAQFADPAFSGPLPEATEIPLVFTPKFAGHGALDHWAINGKSFPDTDSPALVAGRRYRLLFRNRSSMDDHPVHRHRHSFEVVRIAGGPSASRPHQGHGVGPAGTDVEAELTADHPGLTLFHCH
jgi:FtsP/CotA-like multicopper oxidase with cupredoxin domain